MASLTIRNLSDDTKAKLKRQAAVSGRSLEAYVRGLLEQTADTAPQPQGFPYDLMALVEPGQDIEGFIDEQDRTQPIVRL
jgi:plasmid stability protein